MNLIVTPRARGTCHRGTLKAFGVLYDCALGRAGVTEKKREGDGATPIGKFSLRSIHFRADRLILPRSKISSVPITEADGWCDDPSDPANYNRPVTLPHATSAETMWRDDALYDLVVILGHNDAPPIPGRGSAIFLHCATVNENGDLGPTGGCVALPQAVLLSIIPRLTPATLIEIRGAP